jgi:hypothetical protein
MSKPSNKIIIIIIIKIIIIINVIIIMSVHTYLSVLKMNQGLDESWFSS